MTDRQLDAWFRHGNGSKLMCELFGKANIIPIPCGNTGVQMGGWFNKEIKTVADLKGLKMRIGGYAGAVLSKLGVVDVYKRQLLINVARHAETSEASLSFLCNESRLTLAVSDNGRGFDPGPSSGDKNAQNGFGLSSINERVVNIGGEMEIDSSPGNGTTITLTIPISISAKEHRP